MNKNHYLQPIKMLKYYKTNTKIKSFKFEKKKFLPKTHVFM